MIPTLPAEFHGWAPTPLLAWFHLQGVPQLAQLWQRGNERLWLLVPHLSSDALPEASHLFTVCGDPADLTPKTPQQNQ